MTCFDEIDTFYLANSLTKQQLKHEVYIAGLHVGVAKNWLGTPYEHPVDLFPWPEFAATCREALAWQKSWEPKPMPVRGKVNVEAVKAQNDIVSTIEQYTRLRKSGKNFSGCCPIHDEKHPSLFVYPEQQSWYCFGCNRGGDVFDFIQAVSRTDFKGAAAILGGR